jgi:hypothetical protein
VVEQTAVVVPVHVADLPRVRPHGIDVFKVARRFATAGIDEIHVVDFTVIVAVIN